MQTTVQETAQKINSWLLPLLALSLTVSTSALSVLAILIFIFWVLEGNYRSKVSEIFSNKVSIAVLLYLGLHVVGLLWSEDKSEGFSMLEKQWKLMLMPVFLTLVQPSHRRRYVYFFLAGLIGVMLTTYLA